jgi:U3 small nucleolar RNA-associated protein 11
MSSLRNAVKRVTHKERSQPHSRRKLGLLEKHSDYVERANDYKSKRKAIRNLKLKAEQRNPDEFYFKMHKSEMKDGKHQSEVVERNRCLDHSTVQLLKTQDMGYLTHKKSVDDRKIERMKSGLHMIGAVLPRHKVFCESEQQVQDFDAAAHFNTLPELLHRAYNRPRMSDLNRDEGVVAAAASGNTVSIKTMNESTKKVAASYDELTKRIQRRDKIAKTVEELRVQRTLMNSKGSKRKLKVVAADGEEKVVYKWKMQRQR